MQQLIDTLSRIGHTFTHSKGDILFFEGQEATHLRLLKSGKVRLYKSRADINLSTQCTIHTINTPQFIAEMPFFMRLCYPANAECIESCEIIRISFDEFCKHCLNDMQMCLLFITSLCQKIKILESHINMSNQTLQERLLSYLQTHKDSLHTMSQKHIAQSLNIAPQSLSRTLKILKNQGIINTHKGKIELVSSLHNP